MEIFIVLIIIIMICFILNVPLSFMLTGAYILLCIFATVMTLGFLYCFVRLITSKQATATFLRLDMAKSMNRKVAYYEADGTEYPCIFPAENILNSYLYQPHRTYKVMLDRKKKRIYDLCSILTCVLGLLFGIGLDVVLILIR